MGCLAGDEVERRQKELTSAHKQQAELEQRLANILQTRAMSAASSPVVARLQQQLAVSSHELDLADQELKEMAADYQTAREWGFLQQGQAELCLSGGCLSACGSRHQQAWCGMNHMIPVQLLL